MWGLSADQWNIINGLANWFSAIGTISAVIVSLWLASSAGKRKGNLSVDMGLIVRPGYRNGPTIISFTLVNSGDRPFRVSAIGWFTGKGKNRKNFFQLHDTPISSELPAIIQPGDSASWRFDVTDGAWYARWREALGQSWRKDVKGMHAIVTTATGETFICKMDKGMKDQIVAACS